MEKYAFSVDLGGTTTNFSIFKSREIITEWSVPTPQNHIAEMLEAQIKNKIDELNLKNTDFKAVVIGIAGIVKNGFVIKANNLNLSDGDIAHELQSHLSIKVIVLNDVNLQAIGESANYRSLFLVAIGTGLGAGLIVDNHLVEGHNGAAGEIGFLYIDSKTSEENASAKGLVGTVENYLKSNDDYSSLRDIKSLTAKDIFDEAKAGDEVALKIINEVYFKLGKLLGLISGAIDPEVIIISGGISNAGDFLLDIIKKGFSEVSFADTEICISEMKEKASVFGAMKIVEDISILNK